MKLARLFHRARPTSCIRTTNGLCFTQPPPLASSAYRCSSIPAMAGISKQRRARPRSSGTFRDWSIASSVFPRKSPRYRGAEESPARGCVRFSTGSTWADLGTADRIPTGPVLTVARLSPEKDVANLVRATAIAVKLAPGLRVEVAGNGPCQEELNQLAAREGTAGRITFLGEVGDIPAQLARARMFVLPSRSEGIPLTVLEAIARGLPVVATRVGGVPEVVDDGVTGLLVAPATHPPWAER